MDNSIQEQGAIFSGFATQGLMALNHAQASEKTTASSRPGKAHFYAVALTWLSLSLSHHAHALVETEATLPPSLKSVAVPEPADLSMYIKDKAAAIALGKALFWDAQVGSDGQACASCHYHAGADHRLKNQIHPGAADADGVSRFARTPTQAKTAIPGPNYTLKPSDFPFHRLQDPADRNSKVLYDSNDVIGSQGVFQRTFTGLSASNKETCVSEASPFAVAGINVRQTTGRNAPTVINAVFNYRNFWDGRANNIFNGMNPFGNRRAFDPSSTDNILRYDNASGTLTPYQVAIADASLASQAVGPALSSGEMTCAGMDFRNLGRKLLRVKPLVDQIVDATDSVLGKYATKPKGLKPAYTYKTLIEAAFDPAFWQATALTEGYTQMEHNFSLFWGLAIQLYESTLVSDDSPYDRYRENPQAFPLTAQQLNGMNLFAGRGACLTCHRGSEFTAASKSHVENSFAERMVVADGGVALYDAGFYNIGVRPTAEDLGLGGSDPYGNPLSYTRQAKALADGFTDPISLPLDLIDISSYNFLVSTGMPMDPFERDAIDGAFKTPSLRNVELTGPYFHNGGYGTLRQTVEFYHRGGDRRGDLFFGDTTGYAENSSNLAADMAGHFNPLNSGPISPTLGLTTSEIDDIVAFMKTLTDERVRWESAPFDHPSLPLLNGHSGTNISVAPSTTNRAEAIDSKTTLPAVGSGGRSAKKLLPLKAF
jgi:cytochrome c peroxidase